MDRPDGVVPRTGCPPRWRDDRSQSEALASSHRTDVTASRHFVYIVRCADGTLYTGYARDPHARERVHNRGRGAKYTAGRRPVTLVYSESFPTVGEALTREHQLKRWPRAKKEALIERPLVLRNLCRRGKRTPCQSDVLY